MRTQQRRNLNRVVQQRHQQLAPLAQLRDKIRRTRELMHAIKRQIQENEGILMAISDSATAVKRNRRVQIYDEEEERRAAKERDRRRDHLWEEIGRLELDLAEHKFEEQEAERRADRLEREIGELDDYIRRIERQIRQLDEQIEELELQRTSGGYGPNDPRNRGPGGSGGAGGAGAGGSGAWGYSSFFGGSGHHVSQRSRGYDDGGYPYPAGGGGGGDAYQRTGQVCATPKGRKELGC